MFKEVLLLILGFERKQPCVHDENHIRRGVKRSYDNFGRCLYFTCVSYFASILVVWIVKLVNRECLNLFINL